MEKIKILIYLDKNKPNKDNQNNINNKNIYNKEISTEKEKYALNSFNIQGIQKRKHRKKNIIDGKTDPSIFSESKILISYEDEMKAALNNEKIKYTIRISLLKFFWRKIFNRSL